MSLFLYNVFLFLYSSGIHIATLWNKKARLWVNGRKKFPSFESSRKTVWMHCASLGEFEQGRPLLEKIKQDFSSYKIIITFFSPSGYEIRKNYMGADAIFYLPMDDPINSEKFIDIIKPTLVLWIKYEYWYHYLITLKKSNIPVLLVSGIFREEQPFFKWYGKMWKKMIYSYRHLFVQDEKSRLLVQHYLQEKVTANGDTRFDRVIDIAENSDALPEIKKFCSNNNVIVAGSTWEEDEKILIHFIHAHPEIKFIIAPHETDKAHLSDMKKEIKSGVFYSQLNDIEKVAENSNVLIIDNIGMLSRLYKYATITYVGGGFNASGIHNILEAAVYGRPVIFGPVYEKFIEATGLVECGGAFSIKNALQLEALLNDLLSDNEKLAFSSNAAKDYVYHNRGATGRIMNYITENRLLIN